MNVPIARDYFRHTAGVVALIAATVFVAVWMHLQHTRLAVAQAPSLSKAETGADLVSLPKEALLGFVSIPAGSFVMGSDPSVDGMAYENERWAKNQPQGSVMLPAFYIGRYEVTVAQFAAFAAATGRKMHHSTSQMASDYPVTDVSWADALSYARWLERTLRQSKQTPTQLATLLAQDWHITLPSEAQWEKAARGVDGRVFPWGNDTSQLHANFGGGAVKPVGGVACASCAFQLADMSGNVSELTRSPYRAYPYDTQDRADPHADALYVMRGGSFKDPPNNIRAATRSGVDPGARRDFIGFRLVLTKD